MVIYLDHNATTAASSRVRDAVLSSMHDSGANPASSHSPGRYAAGQVASATKSLANVVGVGSGSIVWTSGATEALNAAVFARFQAATPGSNAVVAMTEHKAVAEPMYKWGGVFDVDVREVPPNREGVITAEAVAGACDQQTILVAVMAANNETGAVNPIAEIGRVVRSVSSSFLCDATQALGKIDTTEVMNSADFVAFSAHKCYGPMGVGCLVIPDPSTRRLMAPLLVGGGHQNGLRSGTLNVPGIVGFATAVEEFAWDPGEFRREALLRDRLQEQLLEEAGPAEVHAAGTLRLPNTLSIRLAGVDGEALIANCPGVAFSTGSACTAAVPAPSHVLTAMDISGLESSESVRLSLGRSTTEAEIDKAVELITTAATRIREVNP